MKNQLLKTSGLVLLSSSVLIASGYRIPEQSVNSVARSGAYVANSNGADTSYYNPANMAFNKNKTEAEISLMNIKLDAIKFKDATTATKNGESKTESFMVPTIFVSTKDYKNNGIRYGLSLVAPAGLSKRWDGPYQKNSAQEFTLKTLELNPTISYKISNKIAIAGGIRIVKSEGIVKSDGVVAIHPTFGALSAERDMTGNGLDYGYNLAVAYKPDTTSNVALTYRSKVNLSIEGSATLSTTTAPTPLTTDASVSVPIPAVLSLAYSKKFGQTIVEMEYDKTYWSAYKELDFEYDKTLTDALMKGAFDDPKDKKWKDTNAYRIGISHQYTNDLTLMVGFAIDKNPVPTNTLGDELPDSDAKLYSVGTNYKLDDKSSVGFGYLLDVKEDRTVNNDKIDGEFTNAKAHIYSFSYRVAF